MLLFIIRVNYQSLLMPVVLRLVHSCSGDVRHKSPRRLFLALASILITHVRNYALIRLDKSRSEMADVQRSLAFSLICLVGCWKRMLASGVKLSPDKDMRTTRLLSIVDAQTRVTGRVIRLMNIHGANVGQITMRGFQDAAEKSALSIRLWSINRMSLSARKLMLNCWSLRADRG